MIDYDKNPTMHTVRRLTALKLERSSHEPVWHDVQELILPQAGRFYTTDRNRGQRKDYRILDSTATRSLRVMAAGFMAGLAGPSQPWFQLATPDPELNKSKPVAQWLSDVADLMRRVFSKSNTYRSLHVMFEELGAFGSAASIVMPNYKAVIHHHPQTAGMYYLATNYLGDVDTFYRDFELPVANVVQQFGYANCSKAVQMLYDRCHYDKPIRLIHAIEPRPDEQKRGKAGALAASWREAYVEWGAYAGTDGLAAVNDTTAPLWESGYSYFPVLAPRWIINGNDIYGTSPGRDSIGDVAELQTKTLRKAQAIDLMTNPPLQAPTSLKSQPSDFLPGGVTYFDASSQHAGIRTAFEVQIDQRGMLEDIVDTRTRIKQTFFEDIFMMILSDDRSNITAREIAERHNEKMMVLGPVLERLQNEMLSPLIDITFTQLREAGALPPPPQEMADMPLDVEFIGILAQAQKLAGAQAIDRLIGTVGALAQLRPEAADKLDPDEMVDEYAAILGVKPSLVLGDEAVASVRQTRAQAQAAQAGMAQQQATADTAAKLASAPTGPAGANALTDIAAALGDAQGLQQ